MAKIMKRTIVAFGFMFAALTTAAMADSETSVSNAFGLCRVFDGTDLLSEPCSVSGWNSSVDVKMDTSGGEARKICSDVADMMRAQGIRFDAGWKIRIYSPFSGDSTIAQCNL
jgi:hypothetical protein